MPDVTPCDRAGDDLATLRAKAQQAWTTYRDRGWAVACYVAEICDGEHWRAWGYRSAAQWARQDLRGFDDSNLSHYRLAGQALLTMAPDQRDVWRGFPVWKVIEGQKLLAKDPPKLLSMLEAGATTAQIRAAVRADPDQHHETEWRTITLRVPVGTYEQWLEARERIANGRDKVSDEEMVTALVQALLQEG